MPAAARSSNSFPPDVGRDGERRCPQDRVVVAAELLAVPSQHIELVPVELRLERVRQVAGVGMLCNEPQQDALAGAADEDRPVEPPPDDLQRLVEKAEPFGDRRKRRPVSERAVLVLVPAGAETEHDATAARGVDGHGHLREQPRVAVQRAGDDLAEPDARRLAGERGEARPALEHRRISVAGLQVVVQPDRVEPEPVGRLRHRHHPLEVAAREVVAPPLRHDDPEPHTVVRGPAHAGDASRPPISLRRRRGSRRPRSARRRCTRRARRRRRSPPSRA